MANQDILTAIENKYHGLSKRQKMIAAYIIKNYDKAAFMTAAVLGEASGVSESTVVRFATTMGFTGYPEMQKQIQEAVKRKMTTVQRMNLMAELSSKEIVDKVLKTDMRNIRNTRELLDPEVLTEAIECLENSECIYVIGYRSSAPLAQFLVYYLNYIFHNVRLVSASASDIYAQLMHAKKKDTVLAIAFPRYATQTIDGMRFAKQKGVRTISITDNEMSPLFAISDISILTRTESPSFVDSLVAPMSIINALVVMAALRNREQLEISFETVEKIWEDKDVYMRPDSDVMPKEQF